MRTNEAKTFFSSTGYDTWITTAQEGRAAYLKEFKDWAEYVKIAKIEPQG